MWIPILCVRLHLGELGVMFCARGHFVLLIWNWLFHCLILWNHFSTTSIIRSLEECKNRSENKREYRKSSHLEQKFILQSVALSHTTKFDLSREDEKKSEREHSQLPYAFCPKYEIRTCELWKSYSYWEFKCWCWICFHFYDIAIHTLTHTHTIIYIYLQATDVTFYSDGAGVRVCVCARAITIVTHWMIIVIFCDGTVRCRGSNSSVVSWKQN